MKHGFISRFFSERFLNPVTVEIKDMFLLITGEKKMQAFSSLDNLCAEK